MNRSKLACAISKIAYARGRLEAEDSFSDKEFTSEIEGLQEAVNILLESEFEEGEA